MAPTSSLWLALRQTLPLPAQAQPLELALTPEAG